MKIDVSKKILDSLPETTVGNKIRKKRLERCITKKDFAECIGSTPKTIDSYEFNRSYPSPKRLVKIAEYLDTPLNYFFDEYYEFIFNHYGKRIRFWREENKLSLKEAAKLLDVSYITLDRWEKGSSYPDRVSFEKSIKIIINYPVK